MRDAFTLRVGVIDRRMAREEHAPENHEPSPQADAWGPLDAWLAGVSPRMRWDWGHLRLVQAALERITRGELKRLAIFMPPRHGKSELVTIRYPVYRLERDPALRVIVAAHTQGLAERFSRRSRELARGRMRLSRERAAAGDWETAAGGGLRAVGVGTGVTGHGADLILIDDPVRGHQSVRSDEARDSLYDWYLCDLSTREEPETPVILIQTRWHEDDLAGRILRSEEGPEWEVIRLPALAETQEERDAWAKSQNRALGEPDPLGRQPDDPLCAERFNREQLEKRRLRYGSVIFAGLYQQNPFGSRGGQFRREWFDIVDEAPPIRYLRFWDCASKVGDRNSYTAGALLGQCPRGHWYLKHMVRGRWEYPDAKRVILQTAAADGRETPIGIEDTANGTALQQDLRRDPGAAPYRIQKVDVVADKRARAGGWSSGAMAGVFHLVRGAWNEAFLDEADGFPYGRFDDQIDAVSGAYEMTVSCGGLLSGIPQDELLAMRRLGPIPGVIFKPPKRF